MLDQVVITSSQTSSSSVSPALLRSLAAQFPSIYITANGGAREPDVVVHAQSFRDPRFDVYAFDLGLDDADSEDGVTLQIIDDDPLRSAALEILNRCQRAIGRRNRHSQTQRFERVLFAHHNLHDLTKPLVRADFNHALDTWQWTLRLDAEASPAVQYAALFHDVERLHTEADVRIEQHAADYQEFKERHAKNGAAFAHETLASCGVDGATCARVAELIAHHERRDEGDAEVLLLNDADALSFFALNSTGFADYYGPDHTRRKVEYTLSRLGDRALPHLATIHLRGDVQELLLACTR